MRIEFKNLSLEKIYQDGREKGKPKYPAGVIKAFVETVDILETVENSKDLAYFHSLGFEKLKKEYKGFYSVRVNKQYRIVFDLIKQKDGTTIIEIVEIYELVDYH